MLKTKPTAGDTRWFVQDRFGMFIHWGLYALPARHEWIKHNEEIPEEKYDVYFRHFDPDLYNPDLWAQAAAGAGMKYFVITTKHHEGFCLWDSKLTDYKAPNTPAGRDLLTPMVHSFRKQNMRVGFYHSLIDWHHPHNVIDPHIGPYRNRADRTQLNKGRDQARYARYLHGQVRELLTKFGKVDILWFDFSYPKPDGSGKGRKDWQSEKLYALVRKLAPHIILDDRLDLEEGWDIKTPEQYQPREWVRVNGQPVVWEACQTFSGSWGYHRDESSWKSIDQLVQMLIDTVSKGGNLLLNVGPTGRGEFDQRVLDRLAGMGEWMKRHSRSIYGCTQAPDEFSTPRDCRLTYHPAARRLYVHVFAWPFQHLYLDGFAGKVAYAQLLNDASEIRMTAPDKQQPKTDSKDKHTLVLNLPVQKPHVSVPVIELFLK
ncbi:MAG: alpha-L-fucosidase [Verrucomicrobia bacterium]|nr:alpha-L-fucosidase [Verrucomicrobiota bacterium]MBU4290170.1 alpha-L-fucosidase [Verrucomicrobiota bacterium]MBU4428749.1 alpha-L-fucosidase [Verrucomicrobiota bacterium]MCG2681426.1 alpha-L-fucosidase [Kiritimatiellia bacterium]